MVEFNHPQIAQHLADTAASVEAKAALAICVGKADYDDANSVTTAWQMFALGYEFADSLFVFTPNKAFILSSSKKLAHLKETKTEADKLDNFELELIERDRKAAEDPALATILDSLKAEKIVKMFTLQEPQKGSFAASWEAAVSKTGLELADGSATVMNVFCVKDEDQLLTLREAARASARILQKWFVPELLSIVQREKKVKHTTLSDKINKKVEDQKLEEYGVKVEDPASLELLIPAAFQSGGEYTVKILNAQSSDKVMKDDCIIASFGMRYKNTTAVIARTYMLNPTREQKAAYMALCDLHQALIKGLIEGQTIASVVKKCVRDFTEKNPSLVQYLPKNFGAGVGFQPRERALLLSAKNNRTIESGMAFSVTTSLSDLPIKERGGTSMHKLKSCSFALVDCVAVTSDGPVEMTRRAQRDFAEVTWADEADDDDDSEVDAADAEPEHLGRTARGSARLAAQAATATVSAEELQARENHQMELFHRMNERGQRQSDNAQGQDEDDDLSKQPDVLAYKSAREFPADTHPCMISTDRERNTVLLPIHGVHVPFHICTIKSVTKSDEGDMTYLRFNFYSPAQALGKEASRLIEAALMRHPQQMFIKTLNFRSKSSHNLTIQMQRIKDMQKQIRNKQAQEKLVEDLVEQPALRIDRTKRAPRLIDVNMYPHISGKKTLGSLEAHANGLRFVSNRGEKIDLIFANIQHAFFQPCEQEHIVLIHFHLKHPIVVGRHQQRDIQFYTDVVEMSQHVDGKGQSTYDVDEIENEKAERATRRKLNNMFHAFCKKVEDIVSHDRGSSFSEFEQPVRDSGFYGTPQREMVLLQPTTSCLVNLTDRPCFVLPLDDVEHVHFERVMFGSKNFDMVAIFKPGTRMRGQEEFQAINMIPMADLENIKTWLDSVVDKTFTQGTASNNWKRFLKDIIRQPDFYSDRWADPSLEDDEAAKPVGYLFLADTEAEAANAEELSEPESVFELSEDEEEEEDDEEFDDAVAEEDEDESDDYEDEDDDDEEGESWDELNRKAAEADKKRERDSDDEEQSSKRQKRRNK